MADKENFLNMFSLNSNSTWGMGGGIQLLL